MQPNQFRWWHFVQRAIIELIPIFVYVNSLLTITVTELTIWSSADKDCTDRYTDCVARINHHGKEKYGSEWKGFYEASKEQKGDICTDKLTVDENMCRLSCGCRKCDDDKRNCEALSGIPGGWAVLTGKDMEPVKFPLNRRREETTATESLTKAGVDAMGRYDVCKADGKNSDCQTGFHYDETTKKCQVDICKCSEEGTQDNTKVPATGAACTAHDDDICVACDSTHHFEDDVPAALTHKGTCIKNDCTCSTTGRLAAEDCDTDGGDACKPMESNADCDFTHHFVNETTTDNEGVAQSTPSCQVNDCTCSITGRLAATGVSCTHVNSGDTSYDICKPVAADADCADGFEKTDNGGCGNCDNKAKCLNGGSAEKDASTSTCTCDCSKTGFHGDDCEIPNDCTCSDPGRKPAELVDCPADGDHCAPVLNQENCQGGYHYVNVKGNGECHVNVCTCKTEGKEPSADCTTHGEEKCTEVNICTCSSPGFLAATGTSCKPVAAAATTTLVPTFTPTAFSYQAYPSGLDYSSETVAGNTTPKIVLGTVIIIVLLSITVQIMALCKFRLGRLPKNADADLALSFRLNQFYRGWYTFLIKYGVLLFTIVVYLYLVVYDDTAGCWPTIQRTYVAFATALFAMSCAWKPTGINTGDYVKFVEMLPGRCQDGSGQMAIGQWLWFIAPSTKNRVNDACVEAFFSDEMRRKSQAGCRTTGDIETQMSRM